MTNRFQKLVEKLDRSFVDRPIDANRVKMTVDVFMKFKEAEQLSELQRGVLKMIPQMLIDAERWENSDSTYYATELLSMIKIDLHHCGLININFED